MPEASDRPQDAGRRHRRRGQPSAATASLLERYQESMRSELSDLLGAIAGETKVGLDGVTRQERPSLSERTKLWDLAMKLGRELGTSVDVPPPADAAAPAASSSPKRRRRIDFG